MKVLVADKLEQSALDGLKAIGCDVVQDADLNGDSLTAAIAEQKPNVLVVRSTKVDASALGAADELTLVIRAGAGVNTIDIEAASQRGVYVANCPGKNSIAVAELAFGLMLSLDRFIPDCVGDLRAGKWNKKAYSKGRGLHGLTLGLVGMGNIAQEMIPRAKAFGMNVIAFSRWMQPESAAALGIARAESLEDLARQSDVLSIHTAFTPSTKGMISADVISKMRPGSLLINTSRAEVVDQEALVAACGAGKIRAGLDVFEGEPAGAEGEYSGPMENCKGIYCTHHVGASTEQAQEAVAAEVVRIVMDYKSMGIVHNVVNVSKGAVATQLLVVRHQDKVGVLAHVLSTLKDEGVNVQEMENIILGGAQSAIAQIALDKNVSPAGLLKLKAHPAVFDASIFDIAKN
jgi:D-3-phosphoglycerate dehydrogenase / 2-oxoglutarate reductase